jgi:NAD(P)-dependent dehydrogenase (short-subunit alcohol dehydrogenase family)
MRDFAGKLAVITGAGTGMGRELARQLASEGCHLALCDVLMDNLGTTRELCAAQAPAGTRITISECDVSNESRVEAFRDEVKRTHDTDHINLLFNNAGIGGGSSFLNDSRAEWDRTFAVCWSGVYLCTRAFMPLLIASDAGHLVNTSSVNGFWACLGPSYPQTAYAAAKFAVKGFTEALIVDTRVNAPHVKISLVMPGHIGTPIFDNSQRLLHNRSVANMSAAELAPFRASLKHQGVAVEQISDELLKQGLQRFADDFRDNAPTSAADAATIILDGVRTEQWRILVGRDAQALDASVRATPEQAYEESFLSKLLQEGHMRGPRSRS